MVTNIFVNLQVADLKKSMAFWQALGFTFNPQFTNESGASLVLGEHIYAMLLVPEFFKTFLTKPAADARTVTEVLTAISVESKEKADEVVNAAIAHGGSEPKPVQDYGWMYSRTFEDLDGHQWEVLYMDITKAPANP